MNYLFNSNRLFLASIVLLFSITSFAQSRPTAAVGSYESGSKIPKDVFKTLPGVGVYVKDAPFEVKYQIVSYVVTMADNEGGVKNINCTGSVFSELAKKCISDYTKPGDIVSIQKIIAKSESGNEVKLPALIYYIE